LTLQATKKSVKIYPKAEGVNLLEALVVLVMNGLVESDESLFVVMLLGLVSEAVVVVDNGVVDFFGSDVILVVDATVLVFTEVVVDGTVVVLSVVVLEGTVVVFGSVTVGGTVVVFSVVVVGGTVVLFSVVVLDVVVFGTVTVDETVVVLSVVVVEGTVVLFIVVVVALVVDLGGVVASIVVGLCVVTSSVTFIDAFACLSPTLSSSQLLSHCSISHCHSAISFSSAFVKFIPQT